MTIQVKAIARLRAVSERWVAAGEPSIWLDRTAEASRNGGGAYRDGGSPSSSRTGPDSVMVSSGQLHAAGLPVLLVLVGLAAVPAITPFLTRTSAVPALLVLQGARRHWFFPVGC